MWTKILTSLPWKWIGIAVAALSALAALVAGANLALSRAKQAGRDEVQAQWNAEKAGAAQASAQLTSTLTDHLSVLDKGLQTILASQAAQGQVITNRIEKEIIREPRYVSTDCAVTDGVFQSINAARGLSASAPAAASAGAGLPTGPTVAGPVVGDSGKR